MSVLAARLFFVALAMALVAPAGAQVAGVATASPGPQALAEFWDARHLDLPVTPLVTHDVLAQHLDRLVSQSQIGLAREVIGSSVEGRPIWHVTAGRGPTHVLLWSQMHGDEATATSALLDLMVYIERESRWLERLTLHMVPMVNPDGAQRFQRRSVQGIDVNRDAARLQTPEARALMALRDRVSPAVGFNLHNQNWRTSVGRPPQPAAISLLSVAYDEARTENAGRVLTKRLGAVIRDALEPLAAGRLGRYDDEFEPRAFGDLVTRAGTPVLLIETGPWPGRDEDADRALVRLNFVALASALEALATGTVDRADSRRYDSLPENEQRMMHTIIRNARVQVDADVPPFVGDIGIVASRAVAVTGGQRTLTTSARVEDLGDLSVYGALNQIDARGQLVTPVFDAAARPGDRVSVDPARKARTPIMPGSPAAFWVLEPLEGTGACRLVEILTVP